MTVVVWFGFRCDDFMCKNIMEKRVEISSILGICTFYLNLPPCSMFHVLWTWKSILFYYVSRESICCGLVWFGFGSWSWCECTKWKWKEGKGNEPTDLCKYTWKCDGEGWASHHLIFLAWKYSGAGWSNIPFDYAILHFKKTILGICKIAL